MKKTIFRNSLKTAILLAAILMLGMLAKPTQSSAWDIDKSVEDSRDIGTDLYEATLCHNVLPLNIKISDGTSSSKLLDENFKTSVSLKKDTEIKITSESPMYSIYIIWDSNVPEWTMKIGENSYTYGSNGFLHEYIVLPEAATEVTLVISDSATLGNLLGVYNGGMRVADIYAFPDENIPSWVQTWEKPLTDADILVVSTHADDEYIFFGGVYPTYIDQGKKVQMAYFIQHWGNRQREHEKLNGMWLVGLRNYPILSNFKDAYSSSLDVALETISMEDSVSFMVDTIRQTHPLAVMIHDKYGEYGHGQHRLSSAASVQAVKDAAIATINPESAEKYGTWNTPKLYMHLDTACELTLDYRTPLESYGGKTAIQVVRQGFLCHQSQQGYYTVDDYGKYNNSKFGLIYSTVGLDKNHNDVLENIDYANVETLRTASAVAKTGTDEDFTPIYTAEDLLLMEKDCYGKFRLMRDIDMTGIDWTPIDFCGTFDGNGHSIINLTVKTLTEETKLTYDGNRKSYATQFSGFFGIVNNAEIYDLNLLGIKVEIEATGDIFAGTLCGYTYNTTIKNCHIEGTVDLRVTGKMFGVGGLIGYGGATAVYNSTIDTTLINIDLDKDTRDEQFLGGVYGDGYVDLDGCTINIKGYTSDHGYVHDGGIGGMYILYDVSSHSGFIKNNKVTGFITFFEDNTDRRAYCKPYIGENMSSKYTSFSGNSNSFTVDERKEFDTDLLPHYCTANNYVVSEEADGDKCGASYKIYKCQECNEYTYKSYFLLEHNITEQETITPATYTTEGLAKGICSHCNKEQYVILDMIPLPTPTPSPTDTPTPTVAPTPTDDPSASTPVPSPTQIPNETDYENLFNRILIGIAIVILAIVFAFLPAVVKKTNK